jgi:nucleotide-binding universal stress UspA family protein
MFVLKTVLHPTDFSPLSEYAFHLACALARDYGAHLVLLHVKPPEVIAGEMYPLPADPAETWEVLQGQLEQLRPDDPAIPVSYVLKEGEPVTEILQTAEATHCDLIVMGTHGRTGVGRLLMGSVAESVLRRAPCPVLTAKAPPVAHAAPEAAVEEAIV